ncbi:MAG: c-type cytochrome, partial [Planctomycetota bacterium]|nr:c-type cytochrome [Planctomycetota bacterium]
MVLCLCLFAVWAVGHSTVCLAEDSATGLRARLTSGKQTVDRIDPQIQFSWNDASPDERLTAERFSAVWTGTFLTPAPGEYRFHFFVQGEVRLTIDGKPVTGGELAEPGWLAGETVSLDGRDVPIEVKFVKTASRAVVRMFWAGPGFSIEPVPQRLLECDGDSELHTRETQFANGSQLYSALQCGNCHAIPGLESTRRGPSLEQAGVTISRDWFSDWISGSGTGQENRRMPHFALTPQDAADISAALVPSTKVELPMAKAPDDVAESEQRGQQLFHSLGCLACHTVGKEGTRGRWSGAALDSIGDKRSVDWLAHWLAAPESLNRDHLMPVFPLSEEERLDLAGYLAARKSRSDGAPARMVGDAKRGLELIRKQNCVAC